MSEQPTYNTGCNESLNRFESIVRSIINMTDGMVSKINSQQVDLINDSLLERRELLLHAKMLQEQLHQCLSEQNNNECKQVLLSLVEELGKTDKRLIQAVQQRKHHVAEQIAAFQRSQYIERYIR